MYICIGNTLRSLLHHAERPSLLYLGLVWQGDEELYTYIYIYIIIIIIIAIIIIIIIIIHDILLYHMIVYYIV